MYDCFNVSLSPQNVDAFIRRVKAEGHTPGKSTTNGKHQDLFVLADGVVIVCDEESVKVYFQTAESKTAYFMSEIADVLKAYKEGE